MLTTRGRYDDGETETGRLSEIYMLAEVETESDEELTQLTADMGLGGGGGGAQAIAQGVPVDVPVVAGSAAARR